MQDQRTFFEVADRACHTTDRGRPVVCHATMRIGLSGCARQPNHADWSLSAPLRQPTRAIAGSRASNEPLGDNTEDRGRMREEQPCPAQTSVIVVTYNSRGDIDACLGSLQAHSPDVEIIVVDNLSTDGTLDHVRRHYPRVRAVSAGRNGGYGAGNNIGARLTTGEYLVILNPDTEVEAGWLDPLLDVLRDRPEVGLVTPTILLKGDGEKVNACGNDVHLTGLAFCAGLNRPAPPVSAPPRAVAAVSGAAFAVRREVWERLGGFDERFFMYLEDTDFSLRARRLGHDILHVPASRIRHRYSARVGATKLYHLERNRLLMLRKNLSPRTLALLSPALLLTELLTWAFCLRQGRAYARAKWRSYRRLWRERREPVTMSPTPRHADRAVLGSLGPRLALEQLETNTIATTVNRALTLFYRCLRLAALAIVGR